LHKIFIFLESNNTSNYQLQIQIPIASIAL